MRIIADGSDFPESVRRQLRENEGLFEQMGRRDSEAYGQGFDDQNDRISKSFIQNLVQGLRHNEGRLDATGEQIRNDLLKPLEDQFVSRHGKLIGKQLGDDIREGFQLSGGSDEFLDQFVEDLEKNLAKATRAVDANQKAETALVEKGERDRTAAIVKAEREQASALRSTATEFQKLAAQIRAYHKSTETSRSARDSFIHDLETLDLRIKEVGGDTKVYQRDHSRLLGELRRTHPVLSRLSNMFSSFGDNVGRVFGKGSRNNFLNFFGSLIGSFAELPGLLFRGTQKFLNFGSSVAQVFTDAGGGMSGMFALFSKGAVTIAGLGVAFAVLGVIMGGIIALVGVVTSALLALVGVVVALAASLTFALGAAIAVVAGALFPLIAGLGVAFLAFKSLGKTAPIIKSLKKDFSDLGKEAAKNIFGNMSKAAGKLHVAIKGLGAITGPVSKALGGLLDELLASIASPAFADFEKFLGKVLPGMVTSLGHIFGNLGTALGGLFIAVAPATADFLTWLETVTQKFSDWANSVKGRHEIRDFIREGIDSLKKIGGFLGSVIGLIADLFTAGKDTGDSVFVSLGNTIDSWREKLEKAEKNHTLTKWFHDAKDTADQIGIMVEKLGAFIDRLDTPESRKRVRELAKAFDTVVGVITFLTPLVSTLFDYFVGPIILAVKGIKSIGNAFQDMGGFFKGTYNKVIGPVLAFFVSAVAAVENHFGDLFTTMGKVPGFGWATEIGNKLHDDAGRANDFADSIRQIPDKTVKVTVLAPSQSTIDKINAQLGGIHDRTVTVTVVTQHKGGAQDVTAGKVVVPGNGKVVHNYITMTTPTKDPAAVAQELLNRIAAAAYI